jgi:hypothetical protein
MSELVGTGAVEARVTREPVAWSLPTRIAFRFCFIYLLLYLLPRPFDGSLLPGRFVSRTLYGVWRSLLTFVTGQLLGWSPPEGSFNFGGGDSPTDYVRLLCCAVLALVGAAVWSTLQRSPAGHPRLHAAFRVYLRYVLGLSIISYGMAKFFGQFAYSPMLLVRPLGQLEPMGMLWAFMGASPAYTYATGVVEVAGGLLLLFRRTALLGGVVVAAAMANVVALNLNYDVQVKIQSIHYLAVALFLIAPDADRLARAFFGMQHEAKSSPVRRRTVLAAEVLLTVVVLLLFMQTGRPRRQQATAVIPSIHGLYEVTAFTQEGVSIPPLTTDAVRWRRAAVDRYGDLAVQMMDDTVKRFGRVDESRNAVVVTGPGGKQLGDLRYSAREDGLTLEGTANGRQLTIEMRRIPEASVPLLARKFRWSR